MKYHNIWQGQLALIYSLHACSKCGCNSTTRVTVTSHESANVKCAIKNLLPNYIAFQKMPLGLIKICYVPHLWFNCRLFGKRPTVRRKAAPTEPVSAFSLFLGPSVTAGSHANWAPTTSIDQGGLQLRGLTALSSPFTLHRMETDLETGIKNPVLVLNQSSTEVNCERLSPNCIERLKKKAQHPKRCLLKDLQSNKRQTY